MKAIYTYKENEKFYVKFFTRKLQITGKEYTTVNSILNKFKNEKQKKRFIKAKN